MKNFISNFLSQILNFLVMILGWLDSLMTFLIGGNKRPISHTYSRDDYERSQVGEQTELTLESQAPPVYRKSESVLTFRERILFSALQEAINNEYHIMVKVRMGDFIWLTNEVENRKFHVNQILCKHVDFLLCGKFKLEPLLVIELDDPSHQLPGHEERDKFKDDTFTAIGLPFLRIAMQKDYSSFALRIQIKEKIGKRLDISP